MSCAAGQKRVAGAGKCNGVPAAASKAAGVKVPLGDGQPLNPVESREQAARRRKRTSENARVFLRAIKEQRQVSVLYRTPAGVRKYTFVPLDIKGGSTPGTQKRRYMWGQVAPNRIAAAQPKEPSERYQTAGQQPFKSSLPLCLRLERVIKVELLEEWFEPNEVISAWKKAKVQPKFNLPRKGWGGGHEARRTTRTKRAKKGGRPQVAGHK